MKRKDGDIINGIYTYKSSPMPNHCIECDKPTKDILCDKCKEYEDTGEEDE